MKEELKRCQQTSHKCTQTHNYEHQLPLDIVPLLVLIRNVSVNLFTDWMPLLSQNQPGMQLVQALSDILHSALPVRCHSNETRALTANPPNSAQLQGTANHSPKLHPGLCISVGMQQGTYTETQTAVTNIHFTSATPHAKCNNVKALKATQSNDSHQ